MHTRYRHKGARFAKKCHRLTSKFRNTYGLWVRAASSHRAVAAVGYLPMTSFSVQDGIGQVGIKQVCIGQVGAKQVCIGQVGTAEIRTA